MLLLKNQIYVSKTFLIFIRIFSSTLDAVKQLLDNGTHDVNELEPTDNISPLHVAAAWDNLAMCQLLVHYGANINALDIDKRSPLDLASGRAKKFLKKLRRKNKSIRFKRFLSFLFSRQKPLIIEQSPLSLSNNSLKLINQRSCPALLPFPAMGAKLTNEVKIFINVLKKILE